VRTLVAVIAYNEARNLGRVLDDLAAHNTGFDVVVIDNGSSDRTPAICRERNVDVVSHCINTGGSFGTVRTYFLYARRKGYDVLCQFDGDGQHGAAELPKIIDPIASGRADYVIGSRFLTKEAFQSSFPRRIGIRFFSLLDSAILGQRVLDVTSGFRAYGPRVIRFFANDYRHELYDTNQMLLLAHFSGARILEVPVRMEGRRYGKSEFTPWSAVLFPLKGLVNIAGCVIQAGALRRLDREGHGNPD
jgi:glycosyltransferase involved in cell wall biosynthesis